MLRQGAVTRQRDLARCGMCGQMMDLKKEGEATFLHCRQCAKVRHLPFPK